MKLVSHASSGTETKKSHSESCAPKIKRENKFLEKYIPDDAEKHEP